MFFPLVFFLHFIAIYMAHLILLSLQVDVEGCDAGKSIDLVTLDGTWRLQYTSAPDVLILLDAAERYPFFQVQH